jgi:AraC family transcriptional regulator of adaptative response / DNA-3-methyladenine glycosylase II
MNLDSQQCYAAVCARDARFDGVFYVGVSTTGVYCRPVCRVRTPGRDRCSYYPSAGAAEAAGYRPCLRCRPELAPGAAPSDAVRRVARLAVARIESGALEDRDLEELAAEFGISSRQLRRNIEREFGVAPVALAQTRRLLLAKQLLTDTRLSMTDVAFASGFSSVRRFNHLFRTRYRLQPSALRRSQGKEQSHGEAEADAIALKLAYRPPLAWEQLGRFLASRAPENMDRFDGKRYLRTVRLAGKTGWIEARLAERGDTSNVASVLLVQVSASLLPVFTQLLPRLRALFDLDADPAAIAEQLGRHPLTRRAWRAAPGLRVPGVLDGFELALRAVLGQQVSVRAATTLYGRVAERFGDAVETPHAGLNRLPAHAEAVAQAGVADLMALGLTGRRAETVRQLAIEVAAGRLRLVPGVDPVQVMAALRAIPGIGPWTTEYITLRALRDPDAFPHDDLVLLKASGLPTKRALLEAAETWRPWRAYAAMCLWHTPPQEKSAPGPRHRARRARAVVSQPAA